MDESEPTIFDGDPLTAIGVEHAFDLEISFRPLQMIASPAVGMRLNFVIDHGVARGPMLDAEFLPGGGDWVTIGSDSIARLDVRATLQDAERQLIYMTNTGRSVMDESAIATFYGGSLVGWRDAYARSSPLFETTAEEHRWLNGSVFVAVNEFALDRVHYRIYRVA